MKKKKVLIFAAALLVLLGVIFGIAYLVRTGFTPPSVNSSSSAVIKKYMDQVIAACEKDSYPPRCYDTELPKLMDKGVSMEDVFKVTAEIQKETNGYYFCHVLGHNVAAKESAKDVSKWTEVVARCPTGMCSNGCLHGAAQERFRSEALTPTQIEEVIPQLASICQNSDRRKFTGLEQASCYHALGHLSMYITNADIHASTNICDRVARFGEQNYTQTCYEGAYMQIFQPLEPEDFTLVKDIAPKTTAESESYCNTFSGERHGACHRESWPLYRESLQTAEGLQKFCSVEGDPTSERRCYNGMFYMLVAQMDFDITRITTLCEALPKNLMAQCFANAASRSVETDYQLAPKAIELCEKAESLGVGNRCYGELLFYSSFNYHEGSPQFVGLCNQLPEPFKGKCLRGEGKTMNPGKDIDQ